MSRAAKVFLVLLRIAIGWHFLYEGVFKIDSDRFGDQYLTSRYFLQSSTGRLRDFLTGTDGGEKPNPQLAAAQVDQWYADVLKHFKSQDNELSEEQKARLAAVCDQIRYSVLRGDHEPINNSDWFIIHEEVLKVASEQEGQQHFTSLPYLQSSAGPFRALFRGLAPDVEGIERLTVESAQARIDGRYHEIVRHFESRGYPFTAKQRAELAAVREGLKQSIGATLSDPAFHARIADYKLMLQRVRHDAAQARVPYSKERLDEDRKRLDTIGGELLGFVNEPLAELTRQARSLATVDQMTAGPPPRPREQTHLIDWMVKWGLTAIGVCLVLGLFTPFAAAAAAAQLAMFYLASPPFPGLPATAMAGGHYLYVDRNLIELIAVLVVLTVPTGRWAGLDSLLPDWQGLQKRLWRRLQPVQATEFVERS